MLKKLLLLCLLLTGVRAKAQGLDSLTFAVLGNSISTYYDYIPSGYAIYYSAERERNYGIQVGDQWWMQLSRLSGLTFLANASWSGSRVAADVLNSNAPFLSNHRVNALGRAGDPDFIFIAGGTNDWNAAKVPLGEYRTENFTDSVTFRGAYQRLLWKLTTWYPKARVVCLSILPRGESSTQKNAQGWSQADANASIKRIAEQFGQYYIDCTAIPFSSNWSLYMLPGNLHPSAAGFKIMAQHIYNRMISQRIITRDLKRSGEVGEAERLLDLSFTADGIVNNGTYPARIGKHGSAATFYDAARNTYYGCTKARQADYFFATFDDDTPLSEAFNNAATWEMLVRLDALADHGGNINRTCLMGCEENGGWAFYNSALASTFSYQHKSGLKSSVKSIEGDSILVPGKFYHLVVTMDRLSHVMRYFINGKLVCTGTRAGTDMALPQNGSVRGRKNMWLCLGGDATSSTFSSSLGAENSSALSIVFARVYGGALTQQAAQALYNDNVKQFTEPQTSHGTELILDMELTPDGAVNHAPSFPGKTIPMEGEVPIAYNADINLYEAQFSGSRMQYFKYCLADEPAIMSQLSDACSVEVFCRNSKPHSSTMTRPIGLLNGYGFGLQMNSKASVAYTTTTQGNKADGTAGKTGWTWIDGDTVSADYTHYVIVYDRPHFRSQLFVGGKLKDTRWLTFKECPVYEWTPSTWLAIGGDAKGNYDATTSLGTYPFRGDVALVRIYGRALSASEVQNLTDILSAKEWSYTLGANGYAAVCLPFAYSVPEGCTAFIVSEIATPSVKLLPIAQAGQRVPYGTPVIIKGEPKASITLTALNKNEPCPTDPNQVPVGDWNNLLSGTYAGRVLLSNEGYYLRPTATNLYRATGTVTLPPFSCYLVSPERRTYYKIEELDAPDGINMVRSTETNSLKAADGDVYDLSGRKATRRKLPRGVYVEKGKKVVVSNR